MFVYERAHQERERRWLRINDFNNNNNNPLYEANDNEGVNPMYTDKETVKNTNEYGKVKSKYPKPIFKKTQKKKTFFKLDLSHLFSQVNDNIFWPNIFRTEAFFYLKQIGAY